MQLHMTEGTLAKRWQVSRRTLQRWRQQGTGPSYLVLGRRVVYCLQDVLVYENARRVPCRDELPAPRQAS